MAIHTHLPIYKVAYDLLDASVDYVANMPRTFKIPEPWWRALADTVLLHDPRSDSIASARSSRSSMTRTTPATKRIHEAARSTARGTAMLILLRRIGERIMIGDDLIVTVIGLGRYHANLSIQHEGRPERVKRATIGETTMIGEGITLAVVGLSRDRCRLGIRASKSVAVHREEVYERIKRGMPPPPRRPKGHVAGCLCTACEALQPELAQ